jgi:glucosamine-6-phosphate deaminase
MGRRRERPREGDVGSYSVRVVDSYEDLSRSAADAVQRTVEATPDAAITVPTGQTPLGMYEELVRRVRSNELDLGRTHIFLLDEYLGQGRDDEASLTRWLYEAFLSPAGIAADRIHEIPSMAEDPEAAAVAFEQEIADLGGLGLAVVGLGPNGHVAFNEPGSSPDSRTRVLDLAPESRTDRHRRRDRRRGARSRCRTRQSRREL